MLPSKGEAIYLLKNGDKNVAMILWSGTWIGGEVKIVFFYFYY
jgi:hypothetical protein